MQLQLVLIEKRKKSKNLSDQIHLHKIQSMDNDDHIYIHTFHIDSSASSLKIFYKNIFRIYCYLQLQIKIVIINSLQVRIRDCFLQLILNMNLIQVRVHKELHERDYNVGGSYRDREDKAQIPSLKNKRIDMQKYLLLLFFYFAFLIYSQIIQYYFNIITFVYEFIDFIINQIIQIMILKNNIPQFKTTYALLLQKDQQIRNNLKELNQCKNKTFTNLQNQIKNKDQQIKQLQDKFETEKKKVKIVNKKLQQMTNKNKKLMNSNEDLKFKLQLEIEKNEMLKQEMKQNQNSAQSIQKIQRQYIQKLESQLFQIKLESKIQNKKKKSFSLTKSNKSKNTGLDLSKVFQEETVHSFNNQSFIQIK